MCNSKKTVCSLSSGNLETGLRYLTRLQLGFSHVYEHKFKHSFLDLLSLTCSCGFDI